MRTTLNTIYSRINTNLGKITTDMAKINEQISSGLQMSKLSDEPVNLVSALRFRSTITELDQYTENIQSGNTIITAAETALTQMKDLALRAKTLSIQATDPGYTTANREAIAEEINNMHEQAVALANTQVNGKYIFGGFRTTGYTETEPAPFMIDKGDGYWINGTNLTPVSGTPLTGTIPGGAADITDGSLLINGINIGLVTMPAAAPATDFGLNMGSADALNNAINNTTGDSGVTSSLTTLFASSAATADNGDGTDTVFSFDLNGIQVIVPTTDGDSPTAIATATVAAIRAVADQTGVWADVGDGLTNGGDIDSVVFRNVENGDDSDINITNYNLISGDGSPGFGPADISTAADASHNTGEITFSPSQSFTLTSPNNPGDDNILNILGLGGGSVGVGFNDVLGDGTLVYGYPLDQGDLSINGQAVPDAIDDGVSTRFSDASAAAKASAINSISAETGVTAVVVPAQVNASGMVQGGTATERLTGTVTNSGLAAGAFTINNTAIGIIVPGAIPPNGLNQDEASIIKTAINLESTTTGVYARLTTLYSSGVAAQAGNTQTISFDINNVKVSLITGGVSEAATAADVVKAINAVSKQSGVQAVVGDGSNGGIQNSIVLRNVIHGDETEIALKNISAAEETLIGLPQDIVPQSPNIYRVSNTNNTGEISLESDSAFIINGGTDDTFLASLGLSSETNNGQISYGSTPNLKKGDLTINGIPIITTAIDNMDVNNTLLNAINDQSSRTGVKATRGANGVLQLTAEDGRNIHVETSANGEAITNLTKGIQDQVTFGTLQLRSERKFILETSDPFDPTEPGLATIGLVGGKDKTGEPDDDAGDGKINVFSIHDQTGSVRYTGDRVNDLEIKIGKTNTMTVGENGKTGIMDTTIFSTLKALENYLLGDNFTTVTGIHSATDRSVTLNSKTTGLEPVSQLPTEDLFTAGSFTVTVTDHDYYPPRLSAMTIGIDPTVDTLDSVSARIDGIANIHANWTSDGQLKIESDDPKRYTIDMTNDSSNFLKATGVSYEFMQSGSIFQSIADLDTLMEKLTQQVSDFGSRANRIDIQSQIYSTMTIATKENLSEVQDTDMVKAVLDLKSKETAYQAALSAAAKTMQLSLVDYLK